MHEKKALVAMSGGVDSSVAAFLAKQAGFSCCGATLRLVDSAWLPPEKEPAADATDARSIAQRLGMDFILLDAVDVFCDQVVTPFIDCYECGGTPNPCIYCNKQLKFGYLLEKSLSLGCQTLVTGHYARVLRDSDTGRFLLYKATDLSKDQSYFLSCLGQRELSHVYFPLGELTKEQVRAIAQEQGFVNARKKDSQDICFIPDGDYKAFMEHFTGKQYPAGNYLDLSGNIVGQHAGAVGYTRGQRKGLGLAMGAPVYVCSKDMAANTVTVGPDEALYSTTLLADGWNWYPFPALTQPIRVNAKVRYRHTPQPATVYPEVDGYAKVVFDEPQRAITAGQAVVLYDGDMVIGGGTIQQIL